NQPGGNGHDSGQTDPDSPVVHFTEAAHAKIMELLQSKGYLEGGALRISLKSPGFGAPEYGMALEESGSPRTDDSVINANGFRVLVDTASLPLVDGATVDFFDRVLQRGFKVEPPPPPPPPARPELDMSNPVIANVQAVLDEQVNPSIAGH